MNELIVTLLNGVIASIATFGFALFMHTPKRSIIQTSIAGGVGWVVYLIVDKYAGPVLGSFLAACFIALSGEIFARVYKTPSIVYILSGMLPLVPGRGLYFTMYNIITEQYYEALQTGTTTLAVAGAIALGIVIVTTSARTISIDKYKKINSKKIKCEE